MELKPCPFCGARGMFEPSGMASVYCYECESGATGFLSSVEEAAAVWNHRPIEDALRAELAAERARLDYVIKGLSYWRNGEKLMLAMGNDPELFGHEIPAGQTARDVIDRLRQEGGDAQD